MKLKIKTDKQISHAAKVLSNRLGRKDIDVIKDDIIKLKKYLNDIGKNPDALIITTNYPKWE